MTTFAHPYVTRMERRDGVNVVTFPLRQKDGDVEIVVGWSTDDEAYVAQISENPVTNSIGVGATQQEALFQLAFALIADVSAWRTMYDERTLG